MFALDICFKDGTVKPNFVEGRLRKYASFSFAYNAGSQMLNNVKTPNIKELYIWDDTTQMYQAIVKRPSKNSNIKTKNEVVKIDTFKIQRYEHNLIPVNLNKEKENQKIKDDENKKKKEEIMTVLKKVQPVKKEENKESRVQILQDLNEKRLKEKESKDRSVCQHSINNLSSTQLQETIIRNTKEDIDFLKTLYSYSIEQSLKTNNCSLLFKTELSMARSGLSWYVDQDGKITVDLTESVLEIISSK